MRFGMNGLRVYTKPIGADSLESEEVFYTKRADGPCYRWFLEQQSGRWQVLRMHSSDFALSELALARWKRVPSALQARLSEHYME